MGLINRFNGTDIGYIILILCTQSLQFILFFFQNQGIAQKGEEVIEQVGLTCLNMYAHYVKFPSLFKKSGCPSN
jgi:hypothetical protein